VDVLIIAFIVGAVVVVIVVAVAVVMLIKGDFTEAPAPIASARKPIAQPPRTQALPATPSRSSHTPVSKSTARKATSGTPVQTTKDIPRKTSRSNLATSTTTASSNAQSSPRAAQASPLRAATNPISEQRRIEAKGDVSVARFVAGGTAKVTATGDDHFGQIGIVDQLYDEDDEYVFLKFKDEVDSLAFRRSEVVPVTSEKAAKSRTTAGGPGSARVTASTVPLTSTPRHGNSTLTPALVTPVSSPPTVRLLAPKVIEFWRGQKTIGRLAVVTVPVVVVVGIIAAVIGLGSRDQGSLHANDQDDMFVEMLEQQHGITMDRDAAVDMAKAACQAPIAGVGLYNAQRELQQRYPDNSLNTVATVIAQECSRTAQSGCRRPGVRMQGRSDHRPRV
jgi:hypothetical protein